MILVKSFNGKSILLVLAYLSMSTVATSHKNPRLFIDKRMIFRFYCHSSTFTYIFGTYFKERYTLIKFNIVYMLYHVIYPSKVSDLIDFYDDKVIYLFLYYTIHLFCYICIYPSEFLYSTIWRKFWTCKYRQLWQFAADSGVHDNRHL